MPPRVNKGLCPLGRIFLQLRCGVLRCSFVLILVGRVLAGGEGFDVRRIEPLADVWSTRRPCEMYLLSVSTPTWSGLPSIFFRALASRGGPLRSGKQPVACEAERSASRSPLSRASKCHRRLTRVSRIDAAVLEKRSVVAAGHLEVLLSAMLVLRLTKPLCEAHGRRSRSHHTGVVICRIDVVKHS